MMNSGGEVLVYFGSIPFPAVMRWNSFVQTKYNRLSSLQFSAHSEYVGIHLRCIIYLSIEEMYIVRLTQEAITFFFLIHIVNNKL
ncbi:unnamed protein product [Adineta ricciae]|uniref:Uncharacterized protein n=1 Tax=Adineta ricciae TaxID=249248 RepID=A0A814A3L6_ADIRI|nr:unnamed protein product [Adineta ricciae]